MIDVSQISNQSSQQDSSELRPIFMIGFYLSFLAILLLFVLIFVDIAIEIQQIVVVVMGLLLLASFSAFKKIINPPQKRTLFEQGSPYFDNRIITSNTYYQGDSYYNHKQNLADAAIEIQELLDKLSKTYDESPIDKSNIDVELLAKIEHIEAERHEKLTDKETIIAVQAVEEIEYNQSLKERLIKAMQAGGKESFKPLLNYPAGSIILSTIQAFAENDATKSTENAINND